jgi:hypothetical protein
MVLNSLNLAKEWLWFHPCAVYTLKHMWENIFVRLDLEHETMIFCLGFADDIFIVWDSKYIRGETVEQELPVL